jgi:hypothetical protein
MEELPAKLFVMDFSRHPAVRLLTPEPLQVAFAFISLGITFHLCIRTVEIDYRLWRLLGLYLVSWFSLAVAYNSIFCLGLLHAVGIASFAGVCFHVGLALSITVYRLLFHRLRSFPGPLGAKLSRFYAVKLASKNLQYHLELQGLHRKYGDFVRTGMGLESDINAP